MADTPPEAARAEPTMHFEDFAPGRVLDLGSYEMTEADIIDFGRRFDPQSFHVDPDAAVQSPFGGLIASGWHTCSVWARLWIDAVISKADSHGSPGMEQVRWLVPVRPGDVLGASVEILDARPSGRRADRGTVFIRCTMTNQRGEVVMTADGRCLIGRRHPARDAGAADEPSDDDTAESSVPVRSADGVNLNLTMMGGHGPDLLVCHATGFCASAYRPLMLYLKERFRVWGLDFRGHGSSDPAPGGDYAWQGMADDVAACAARIAADRLLGFGHSMGGAALLLAEESQPGTFGELYLYEPIVPPEGFFDRPGGTPLARGARLRTETFESRAAAFARYSTKPPLNVLRTDALAAYVEGGFVDLPDGRVQLACRAETEARAYEASNGLTLERVRRIGVPAAVASGTVPGTPDPSEFAPLVAEALPEGRLRHCEGLGHFGPLEAPGVVAADAIRELLGS